MTMIDVTPSNKPVVNVNLNAPSKPKNDEEILQDESSDLVPPRQSDTQLKMKKLGEIGGSSSEAFLFN